MNNFCCFLNKKTVMMVVILLSFMAPSPLEAAITGKINKHIKANVDTMLVNLIPEAPSGLAASCSGGLVTITWQDKSGGKTKFVIERGTNTSNFETIGTINAGNVKFSDQSVKPGLSYLYRIRAMIESSTKKYYSAYSQTVQINIKPAFTPMEFTTLPIRITANAFTPMEFTTLPIRITANAFTPMEFTTLPIRITANAFTPMEFTTLPIRLTGTN